MNILGVNIQVLVNGCIALTTAILGIAFPFIINKESQVGEKFNSTYLNKLFKWTFPAKEIGKFTLPII